MRTRTAGEIRHVVTSRSRHMFQRFKLRCKVTVSLNVYAVAITNSMPSASYKPIAFEGRWDEAFQVPTVDKAHGQTMRHAQRIDCA